MPKRTNEFQKLVALIQKAFAPAGAKVTESAIVDVPGLEGGREIDVLMEGSFGRYELKIAIEAKDERRRMDLTTFESLVGKYTGDGRIVVDKVVVVSRHGFTKNVVRRAAQLGIELVTLAEAADTDWGKFAPRQIVFQLPPHICSVTFDPPIDAENKSALLDRAHLFCTHGTDHGTVRQYAHKFIQDHVLRSTPDLLDVIVREAAKHDRGAIGTITSKLSHHFVRFDGHDHPVSEKRILLHAVNARGIMECTEIELASTRTGTHTIQRARAKVGGKKLEFLFPDGLQSKQIILDVADADAASPAKRPKKAMKRKAPRKGKRSKRPKRRKKRRDT